MISGVLGHPLLGADRRPVSSHSYLNRFSKKLLLRVPGLGHVTSMPLNRVAAVPLAVVAHQPRPCASAARLPVRALMRFGAAPCAAAEDWPPAMRATVSSSFIAMHRRWHGCPWRRPYSRRWRSGPRVDVDRPMWVAPNGATSSIAAEAHVNAARRSRRPSSRPRPAPTSARPPPKPRS